MLDGNTGQGDSGSQGGGDGQGSNNPGGQNSGSNDGSASGGGDPGSGQSSGQSSGQDQTPPGQNQSGKGGGEGEIDFDSLDEKTKNYIKGLRKENANYRTKAKNLEEKYNDLDGRVKKVLGGEENEQPPEERAQALEAHANNLQFENALLQTAVQNGVAGEGFDYFKFLMTQEVEKLGDEEELSEERLSEIVQEVQTRTGTPTTSTTRTSVSGQDGDDGSQNPNNTNGEVTLDEFVNMSLVQKSDLYQKNPQVYEKLMKEAKQKKRLV